MGVDAAGTGELQLGHGRVPAASGAAAASGCDWAPGMATGAAWIVR